MYLQVHHAFTKDIFNADIFLYFGKNIFSCEEYGYLARNLSLQCSVSTTFDSVNRNINHKILSQNFRAPCEEFIEV